MYKKLVGAMSLLALMPVSAAIAAVAFGGDSATIYNANNARAVAPAVAAPGLARAVAPSQLGVATPRMIGGSFGAMPGIVNAPGNSASSNVIGSTTTAPTPPSGGGVPAAPILPTAPNPDPIVDTSASAMTIDDCMSSIETCVNTTLPGGIRNMFDESMRNSILNGMNLCQVEIDECRANVVANVRVNETSNNTTSTPVYRNNADVWVDFNSRRVQPQYYAFTLQKTGLTPRQAEGVCKLLDRNTFGTSFSAVGDDNRVTTEYRADVSAYNNQGNEGFKEGSSDQPMGNILNKNEVDAGRGYYARWDAEQGECLIRVAAYNNDSLIKNTWTAGVKFAGVSVGDGEVAEQWKKPGDRFTCGADLFGFSLLNETAEWAVAGAVGGGVTGAAIGAYAAYNSLNDIDCSDEDDRKVLQNIVTKNGIGCDEISQDCKVMAAIAAKTDNDWKTECATDPIADEDDDDVCSDVELAKFKNAATQKAASAVADVRTAPLCQAFKNKVAGSDAEKIVVGAWDKEDMGAGAGAAIGGAAGAAGGAGLAAAISYFVESQQINCRLGDNLERIGYDKSYTIPSLKDFYVKWALNLEDSVSSNPLPVMNKADWTKVCSSEFGATQDSCRQLRVNYRREGLIQGMVIQNACTWSAAGSCSVNMPTCLSYGICTLADVK